MRVRMFWFALLLAAGMGGFLLSLSQGQERSPAKSATPVSPAIASPSTPSSQTPKPRDLSQLPPLQRQMFLSAQRGADWLYRMNGNDGRFVYGCVPSLKTTLEGDNYLSQAGAALALARAARFTGDERFAARARQAVLTLLADTAIDPDKPGIRLCTLPPALVDRPDAAGLVIAAIHELPAPANDLLDQAEQLCAYLRAQQQTDGSLRDTDLPQPNAKEMEPFPGAALYGLMRSQRHRPAAWKTDAIRKAKAYYWPRWQARKDLAQAHWHSAIYAEAYLLTGEKDFADSVYALSDWLCELQHPALDPRRPMWSGGFMSWADGRIVPLAPHAGSACQAEGLAEACRVARKAGDLPRYQRYREALERSLQFLTRLQYVDANTQHFADWYRPALLGAFYHSHQDGKVCIDDTRHAVGALVQYLEVASSQ